MNHKKIWVLDREGNQVHRDLHEESKNFNFEKFRAGEFDSHVAMWHEMFNHYIHDDIGCDYERYGCVINEGDVVLDIGANIGIFAHRAETRGASRVVSFEPLTPTFSCLIRNRGERTEVHKLAVGGKNEFRKFMIHTDFTHIGGGNYNPNDMLGGRPVVHEEKCATVDINQIFYELVDRVDFMKMDIEGGEIECMNAITDENLQRLRCISAEFHATFDGFDDFQKKFIERVQNLGFNHFSLYHGSGKLRTINCWKK